MSFDLRSWLRRTPRPRKLRMETTDGQQKTLDLGSKRLRWNAVEESVRAAGAITVEALDAAGEVLRAVRLEDEEGNEREQSDDDKVDKAVSKSQAAMAAMFDRYGDRMVKAFEAGANASSMGQDKLVELVDTLTIHLSHAITGLHTASVNLANYITAHAKEAEGGEGNEAMLKSVLALALTNAQASATQPNPNGKK